MSTLSFHILENSVCINSVQKKLFGLIGFQFICSDHYKKGLPECGCLAGHWRVQLNQSGLRCARLAPMLEDISFSVPPLLFYGIGRSSFETRPFGVPHRYFCLSNFKTVLSLCLKTPTKSHPAPCASVFYVLPSLVRMSHSPGVFPTIIPQVRTLIKRTSGRSKLAPVSVPALKFQLRWV